MDFISILQEEGKYDQFCELVKAEGKDWEVIQSKKLIANKYAAKFAPVILPEYFSSSEEYNAIKVESVENETDFPSDSVHWSNKNMAKNALSMSSTKLDNT